MASLDNPILPFIRAQGWILLDGGLASTLEASGHDLNDDLWSAKLLLEDPEAIRAAHLAFLDAGADCIITSSYQATYDGFLARGLSLQEIEGLLTLSVDIAVDARDTFWSEKGNRPGRLRPLVAASIGPYGAFLSDGSEYTGNYDLDAQALAAFHHSRWRVLASSRADLLACETIPSRAEAEVLLGLLHDTPDTWAWMSFSCRNGAHLSDGTRLEQVAELCAGSPQVAAIGINCTHPVHISSLISEARKARPKPILAYPNSGEPYDAVQKKWASTPRAPDLADLTEEWVELGVSGVGGCCRVGPSTIAAMRTRLPRWDSEQGPTSP
jgi:homocysteine S-methyltransferase